jgi:RsiW-degrading membrane proteinase PrsW (M82 family)
MNTPGGQPQGRTNLLANFVPPERSGRKAVLISCGVLIGLATLMSVACTLFNVSAGFLAKPGIAAVAALSAIALGIPYLIVILWLDRNEKEPLHLILTAFLWGAVISTAISCVFNTGFGALAAGFIGHAGVASQLTASFSAPFIEELTKAAAVFAIFLFFKKDFDNVLDGIVYGAVAGLGFAVFENWLYYVNGADSAEQVVYFTVIRGLVAGVGSHACYTALTGAGFGMFRVMRRGVLRWFMPVLGVGLAMFVHFSWNTFAGLLIDQPLSEVSGEVLAERMEQSGWTVTAGPKRKVREGYTRLRVDVKRKSKKVAGKVRLYKNKTESSLDKRRKFFNDEGWQVHESGLAIIGVKLDDAPVDKGPVIRQQLLVAAASPSLKEIASGPILLPAIFIHIPFVLLVLIVAVIAWFHEVHLIKKYLMTEEPPVMEQDEVTKLVPAVRRNFHLMTLLMTFRFPVWWRRRVRNKLLVRLAFEKWHMDQEAQGEDHVEGHFHALRVMDLRDKLTKLNSLE